MLSKKESQLGVTMARIAAIGTIIIFGIAWISMIIGFGYGSYVAWGDKMSSSTE